MNQAREDRSRLHAPADVKKNNAGETSGLSGIFSLGKCNRKE
jgi:hypothetical protein